MNILFLNWRDPKNPQSGGAEMLNMHILKPFIDKGDSVIWYAKSVKGLPAAESYKGIDIIRYGNPLTHLLLWPFMYWSGKLGKPDIIIDSIHGTGYLSSLIAPSKKKIVLICEVAQNIWDEMYMFPINIIGKMWEKGMFKFYSYERFWTISESTKQDLITFGIKSQKIVVLPMGFDGVELKTLPKKHKAHTALFVGRLAEMKGIKDAINAISIINSKSDKKWRLIIIGRGEEAYEKELKNLVQNLKLQDWVEFLGFVDERIKFEEMAKAWVLLVPSSREGWGMIVPEANSVGTTVIAYDVPGLKDVVKKYSPENILIPAKVQHLADALQNILSPKKLNDMPKSGWYELYNNISEYI